MENSVFTNVATAEPVDAGMFPTVTLPKPKIFETPRVLMADAYTVGSYDFESEEAKEKSTYYITFRRLLENINPDLYRNGDDRIILEGLSKICHYLFYKPVTMEEIMIADAFLEHAKVTTGGLAKYSYPRELWIRIIKEFNGRPPIEIKALREGSVVYPNEPVVEVTSKVEGFGPFAAWFESKLLQIWAPTELVTGNEHWLLYCKQMVREVHKTTNDATVDVLARLMLHDFGDRAGICPQESEWLGEYQLLTFGGTDTFAGAYQAWENANRAPGVAVSVKAMAHRNVQSFQTEPESFEAMYNQMSNGDIGSFVADCNDFYYAVENYLLPLALRSKTEGNGKVVVVRPDSGNAVEQVSWICRLAHKNDLSETVEIDGVEWRFPTFMKFIEGNGMSWKEMKEINHVLLEQGFPPFAWGLYGMGGHKRNTISRDNLSAKYALCAVGNHDRGVCKFSEELGKTTLPGPFKLRRDYDSLVTKQTIAFANEPGYDARVVYFDGSNIWKPFGPGMDDTFTSVQERIKEQLVSMPYTMATKENLNFPITNAVREARREILKANAPKKLAKNY